jgi:hypothetical protein
MLEQVRRHRVDEECVDVGVNAAMPDQRVEPDHVRMMCIPVSIQDAIGVSVRRDERIGIDRDDAELGHVSNQIPIRAKGWMMAMNENGSPGVQSPTRFQAEIEYEVQRLGLFAQAEDEVELSGNHRASCNWA